MSKDFFREISLRANCSQSEDRFRETAACNFQNKQISGESSFSWYSSFYVNAIFEIAVFWNSKVYGIFENRR